jgi:hypothetical protein
MFDAQVLIATGTAYSVYGPWMPRGGDGITMAIDVVTDNFSSGDITVDLVTKKSEEAGNGTAISGQTLTGTTGAVTEKTVAPNATQYLEDLVRYKFTVPAATAGNFVIFRMLPASWFDAVKA